MVCFPYFLFDLLWYIHLFTQVGTLRFCGSTEFSGGLWAGVELDKPEGKNDGSVAGVQYFTCRNKHGRSRLGAWKQKQWQTQLLPYLDYKLTNCVGSKSVAFMFWAHIKWCNGTKQTWMIKQDFFMCSPAFRHEQQHTDCSSHNNIIVSWTF